VAGLIMAVLDRLRAKVPAGVLPWVVLASADTRQK
jgi:hypothetical protein